MTIGRADSLERRSRTDVVSITLVSITLDSFEDDGIVVVRSGRDARVEIGAVPAPLRTRLGENATVGLLELLELAHRESREAVINACAERFERRLVEEISGLRVQIAQEMATVRVELLKWCFLFWVGQLLVVGSMIGVMLRLVR